MQITLDSTLEAQTDIRQNDISYQVGAIARTQHPPKQGFTYKVIQGEVKSSLSNTGLVGLLSHCYSKHLPVAIAPHDVWVVLMSEVTKEVASNSEKYRKFFTQSSEQELISVPSASMTEMPMGLLSKALKEKVLFDTNMIFQNFSTETPIVTETIQAIFCDMASPYFSYGMFCCGIPSIELLGTTEDWKKVLKGFTDLVQTFETDALTSYLKKAEPILEQFVNGSGGNVDEKFWKDIFTQENVGSGGDLKIDGWIAKLFIAEHSMQKITHFTGANGVVKYTQLDNQQEFVAVYGGFNTKVNSNGYYELEYSKFTTQQIPY